MEEEPIMCKRIQRLLISLSLLMSLAFAQDVTLTLQPDGNLDYESSSDIYGFQFDHTGCASGAGGGDAADAGFTVSASATTVLAFSFSGSSIPAGSGTLVADVACGVDEITNIVISGSAGTSLTSELLEGSDSADDGAANVLMILMVLQLQ